MKMPLCALDNGWITAYILIAVMPVLRWRRYGMMLFVSLRYSFFNAAGGGEPYCSALSWFFGHPEVYM